jgi:hypothetical protein
MRLKNELIEQAKKVSIPLLLANWQHNPTSINEREFTYLSPLSNERTPSFFVNIQKNVYKDFSTGNGGDAIDLTRKFFGYDFKTAVAYLLGFVKHNRQSDFSFSGHTQAKPPQAATDSKIRILSNEPLTNSVLLGYTLERGISKGISQKYLRQITYLNKGLRYYGIGFANDAGGFELRNPKGFKAKTQNGITVFDASTDDVLLFEGFFDFLSALELYQERPLQKTCIVLNSNVNVRLAYPYFKGTVNCFLDNDASGKATVNKIVSLGYTVTDYSQSLYPEYKDLNDLIRGRKKTG